MVLATGSAFLVMGRAWCQQPDPPGQVKGADPKNEAYLFAHMVDGDYGRLYYTVSLDGLHWKRLNGGKRVFEEYRGHSDIGKGHDGKYYLIGNRNEQCSRHQFLGLRRSYQVVQV